MASSIHDSFRSRVMQMLMIGCKAHLTLKVFIKAKDGGHIAAAIAVVWG